MSRAVPMQGKMAFKPGNKLDLFNITAGIKIMVIPIIDKKWFVFLENTGIFLQNIAKQAPVVSSNILAGNKKYAKFGFVFVR